MGLGDLVVVLGGFDNRVRDHQSDTLIIGTLYQFLADGKVCVILENNDLWVGEKSYICLASEQS